MQTIHDPDIEELNLRPLFPTGYRQQRLMGALHPGQASWVWEVSTDQGPCIVRTSRFKKPPHEDFWQGALKLFGANTSDVARTLYINRWLSQHCTIPVPRIYRSATLNGRVFLVIEKMAGRPLKSFSTLAPPHIYQLGEAAARIHQTHFDVFGSPLLLIADNAVQWPLSTFPERLAHVMSFLAQNFYAFDTQATPYLNSALHEIDHLYPIDFASAIMLDMDPTQFLVKDRTPTALVDTELFVVGPRQLELIGLEYLLNAPEALVFRQGYQTVLPFPPLSPYRHPFRSLLRLMSFQGSVDWNDWMNAPIRFADD